MAMTLKETASMAGTQQGDDDERVGDLDTKEINDPDVAKKKIIQLRKERIRETDYQTRLQRKLTKLDEALASKREEVESTQRTLQLEKGKEQSEKESAKREGGAKEKNQQESILKALSEVLYTKQTNSGGKAVTTYELDTVLVTYIRGKFRYPLHFRINDDTSINTLRLSACKYWGMKDPEQFILKTMANNKCQDEVRVKECFKQGELAQLRLTMKETEVSAEPTEDEKKAIQPKGSKKKVKGRDRGFDPAGADKQQHFTENYFSELKKFGGIYFLLRSRDSKPAEHQAKIRLCDIIVYCVLAALSFYVYFERRPPGYEFWYIRGVEEVLMRETPFPEIGDFSDRTRSVIPSFTDVSTQAEMWDWMIYTLPDVLWAKQPGIILRDHGIGAYNVLLGYLSIRIQNVRPEPCENVGMLAASLGLTCYPKQTNEDTRDTSNLGSVESYWNLPPSYNDEIRGMANPGTWVSSEQNIADSDIANSIGYVDAYDASGYSVNYKLQPQNVSTGIQQYTADLMELQTRGWIGQGTRVTIISFTLFNFEYDEWMACNLIFEQPPTGAMYNTYSFRPFKPAVSEIRQELEYWYIDCIRLLLGFYIIVFVGYSERRHKIRNHKAGCWYHASMNGICDVGIVACLMCVVIWRAVDYEDPSTKVHLEQAAGIDSGRFKSYVDRAFDYETIYVVEGVLMLLTMMRMLGLTRLNYYVMQVKRTLGRAMQSFCFFLAIFLPMLGGFVFISHTVFGPNLEEYSLISKTTVQMYHLGEGNLNLVGLMNIDVGGTMFTVVTFYAVLTFLLLNAFATVVIDAHYFIRLNSGGRQPWSKEKWFQWSMPTLVTSIINQTYRAFFPPTTMEGIS